MFAVLTATHWVSAVKGYYHGKSEKNKKVKKRDTCVIANWVRKARKRIYNTKNCPWESSPAAIFVLLPNKSNSCIDCQSLCWLLMTQHSWICVPVLILGQIISESNAMVALEVSFRLDTAPHSFWSSSREVELTFVVNTCYLKKHQPNILNKVMGQQSVISLNTLL